MAGRTWLAVILCFFVWWGYTKFFMPPLPAPTPQGAETATALSSTPKPNAEVPAQGSGPFAKPAMSTVSETKTTEDLKLSFSKFGGRIVNVVLPKYTKAIELDPSQNENLISPLNQENFAFSLATLFTEKSLSDLAFGEYAQSELPTEKISEPQNDGTTKERERPAGLKFVRTGTNGVTASKSYRVSESGYDIDVEISLKFPEGDRTDWGSLLIPVGGTGLDYDLSQPLKHWRVTALQNSEIEEEEYESLEGEAPQVLQGETGWLSFGNRYFTSVVATQSTLNPDVVFQSTSNFTGGYLRFPLNLTKERELKFRFQLYIGPKDTNYLVAVPGLSQLVDYGWVSVLAHPLLALLKIFYSFCHNYGIAIILLTLLVRGAFYPLTAKSMKSMKEMQKLAPQLKALKEKYGDDRERMQREQMNLYKAHKINPAAGCLPMLIQLPVFIALYQVLANAMELFHAPFFGWVLDLSAKDPYYIYPILMGLTMLIQQKMTPNASMDPAQQKIMYIMPVVFTFIMLNLPSGLTLYIFVSTLLGIAQQYAMKVGTPESVPVKVGNKGAAKG